MMLISKNARRKMATLLVGTSLISGCSSGPGTSFTRFWPERRDNIQWEDDEALADKWRDRIRESSDGSSDEGPKSFASREMPRESGSRFNLFKAFRKNKDASPDPLADPKPLTQAAETALPKSRTAAPADPFLAAELREAQRREQAALLERQLAAVRTAPESPASQRSAPAPVTPVAATSDADNSDLPEWARESAPARPARAAADDAPATKFLSREFGATGAGSSDSSPTRDPLQDPFAELARMQPSESVPSKPAERARAAEHPLLRSAESKPQSPAVADAASRPTSSSPASQLVTDPAEHARALAALEVSELMKLSRIQARAGQLSAALNTAVEAEQLASSAQVRFAYNEQTPLQLISWLRTQTETGAPATASAADSGTGEVPQWPGHTAVAGQPQTQPATTEMWTAAERRGVAANDPRTESVAKARMPLPAWNPMKPASKAVADRPEGSAPRYTESARPRTIDVQPVSREIYSRDNLRWARLDEAEATLIPGPPHLSEPEFVDEPAPTPAFERRASTAPPAPEIGDAPAAAEQTPPRDARAGSGLSTGRVALLLLSIAALAGAILFRRRHMPLQG